MNKPPDKTERDCGHGDAIAPYLAGELSPSDRAALEQHMAQCAACRRKADALQGVLCRLKAAPDCVVARDLAPVIMSKLDQPGRFLLVLWSGWGRVAAAAAAVLILLAGIRLLGPGTKPADLAQKTPAAVAPPAPALTPAAAAQEWLCRTQEPDGSWDTTRWGGHRNFEVALAALSLMALLEEEQGAVVPGREAAARKAADYLMARQAADGSLGPAIDSAPYNQGIGTLALLLAGRRLGGTALKDAGDRALAVILARQNRDGGWGYLNEATPQSNLSITLWQTQSLRFALSRGRDDVAPAIEKGLRWIASVSDERGAFGYNQSGDFPSGYQTLTAMGAISLFDAAHGNLLSPARRRAMTDRIHEMAAHPESDMDYYRRYFLSAALRRMDQPGSQERLAALQSDLTARQISKGADSGSWAPDDRWSSSGGRVYATSLASLSLRSPGF